MTFFSWSGRNSEMCRATGIKVFNESTVLHNSKTLSELYTLYIFTRYSRLSHVREKYIVKITLIMLHRGNDIKSAKINPCKIANFWKFAKMYARENIYVHSIISCFYDSVSIVCRTN